ncbi:hypothetical protein ACA910_012349 [Epithemia clementina (nom. ined.)]
MLQREHNQHRHCQESQQESSASLASTLDQTKDSAEDGNNAVAAFAATTITRQTKTRTWTNHHHKTSKSAKDYRSYSPFRKTRTQSSSTSIAVPNTIQEEDLRQEQPRTEQRREKPTTFLSESADVAISTVSEISIPNREVLAKTTTKTTAKTTRKLNRNFFGFRSSQNRSPLGKATATSTLSNTHTKHTSENRDDEESNHHEMLSRKEPDPDTPKTNEYSLHLSSHEATNGSRTMPTHDNERNEAPNCARTTPTHDDERHEEPEAKHLKNVTNLEKAANTTMDNELHQHFTIDVPQQATSVLPPSEAMPQSQPHVQGEESTSINEEERETTDAKQHDCPQGKPTSARRRESTSSQEKKTGNETKVIPAADCEDNDEANKCKEGGQELDKDDERETAEPESMMNNQSSHFQQSEIEKQSEIEQQSEIEIQSDIEQQSEIEIQSEIEKHSTHSDENLRLDSLAVATAPPPRLQVQEGYKLKNEQEECLGDQEKLVLRRPSFRKEGQQVPDEEGDQEEGKEGGGGGDPALKMDHVVDDDDESPIEPGNSHETNQGAAVLDLPSSATVPSPCDQATDFTIKEPIALNSDSKGSNASFNPDITSTINNSETDDNGGKEEQEEGLNTTAARIIENPSMLNEQSVTTSASGVSYDLKVRQFNDRLISVIDQCCFGPYVMIEALDEMSRISTTDPLEYSDAYLGDYERLAFDGSFENAKRTTAVKRQESDIEFAETSDDDDDDNNNNNEEDGDSPHDGPEESAADLAFAALGRVLLPESMMDAGPRRHSRYQSRYKDQKNSSGKTTPPEGLPS